MSFTNFVITTILKPRTLRFIQRDVWFRRFFLFSVILSSSLHMGFSFFFLNRGGWRDECHSFHLPFPPDLTSFPHFRDILIPQCVLHGNASSISTDILGIHLFLFTAIRYGNMVCIRCVYGLNIEDGR